MTKKHKSILKSVIEKVTKISWLKGARTTAHKYMKPGKDFNNHISNHAFDYMKELISVENQGLLSVEGKDRLRFCKQLYDLNVWVKNSVRHYKSVAEITKILKKLYKRSKQTADYKKGWNNSISTILSEIKKLD